MTTGDELKHILNFALPMLAGNLFQQLYNIVDSVIVGRHLGYLALASVGTTGSITYLFYTLCIGLSTASGILIAQRFGAKEYDDVKRSIKYSICTYDAVSTYYVKYTKFRIRYGCWIYAYLLCWNYICSSV